MAPDKIVDALDYKEECERANDLTGDDSLVEGKGMERIRTIIKRVAHNI